MNQSEVMNIFPIEEDNVVQVLWLLSLVKEMKFGQLTTTFRVHNSRIEDITVQSFTKKRFAPEDTKIIMEHLVNKTNP